MLDQLKENATRLIAANPQVRRIVARALEVEQEGRRLQVERAEEWNLPLGEYLGRDWHAIPCPPARLRNLSDIFDDVDGKPGGRASFIQLYSGQSLLDHYLTAEVREKVIKGVSSHDQT